MLSRNWSYLSTSIYIFRYSIVTHNIQLRLLIIRLIEKCGPNTYAATVQFLWPWRMVKDAYKMRWPNGVEYHNHNNRTVKFWYGPTKMVENKSLIKKNWRNDKTGLCRNPVARACDSVRHLHLPKRRKRPTSSFRTYLSVSVSTHRFYVRVQFEFYKISLILG